MAYCDKWRFNDCTIVEDIDCFEVEVVRHGVHAHQTIVPADMEEFRDALDTALMDEALADGPSPLYCWEDGAGVTLGIGMLASRQDLASIIRGAEYLPAVSGPDDVGYLHQYGLDDGRRLVVYTGHLGDDWTDDDVVRDATCYGAVGRYDRAPDRWDMIKLFSVED